MNSRFLTEFSIPLDRHVIRASEDILGQILSVKDLVGQKIFQWAERKTYSRTALLARPTPFAMLEIVDEQSVVISDGVVIQKRVEIVVDLVFQLPVIGADSAPIDVQAYAEGLVYLVSEYLQPQTEDNPGGMVKQYPAIWLYSTDTNFKQRIDRTVSMIQENVNLSGTYWSIPLQFKLDIFPTVPLP